MKKTIFGSFLMLGGMIGFTLLIISAICIDRLFLFKSWGGFAQLLTSYPVYGIFLLISLLSFIIGTVIAISGVLSKNS